MSKSYERIVLTPLDFLPEGPVLNGSHTDQAIKVNSVTVDPFDPGFVDGSGNEIPFQDITFD